MSTHPSRSLKLSWVVDPVWLVIVAMGVAIFIWTVRRYPPPPSSDSISSAFL
jgi:hypothetical protein